MCFFYLLVLASVSSAGPLLLCVILETAEVKADGKPNICLLLNRRKFVDCVVSIPLCSVFSKTFVDVCKPVNKDRRGGIRVIVSKRFF